MREVVVPTFVYMPEPIPKVLAQVAAAGIRLVELHGDAPETHIDLMNDVAISELMAVVRGLPIEVHSVHCAFSQPSEEAWDISQPDEAKRLVALRNRVKVIQMSARLGAHHVVIHPGATHCSEERLACSRASLTELAKIAQEAGIKLAVENLPPDQLGGSLSEIEYLLDNLDPSVMGFCLDTGHAMLGQNEPSEYIRALGGRLLGIHWHGNDHANDGHLFPDTNKGDWDDFLAALDEVGYDLPVTVEAVPPPTTSLAKAIRSVEAALQVGSVPRIA